MDLKHLRTFVILAEELSFRKAAEKLNLTQPPISLQLSKLEEELGLRLLNRGRNQKISLTPAGKFFLGEARAALRVVEQAIADVRHYQEGNYGEIRISFSDDYLFSPLANALAKFGSNSPEVSLRQSCRRSHVIVDQVESGDTDLGFFSFPVRQFQSRFTMREVVSSQIVAIVPSAHKLAKRKSISVKELKEDAMYLPAPSTGGETSPLFARLFGPARFSPKTLGYSESAAMLSQIVGAGHGVALASEMSIPEKISGASILRIKDTGSFVVLGLAYNPSNPSLRMIEALIQEVDHAFDVGPKSKLRSASD